VTHRWVGHTSEVELWIEATTEADVFREGALALAELLGDEPHGEPRRREVELEARDRASLLADWLGELVYVAETDELLPERVEVELDDSRLRGTLVGRSARPRHLVKAITYHGLELAEADGGWRARVVLDV
jgi:SHS2 domain-containing protein